MKRFLLSRTFLFFAGFPALFFNEWFTVRVDQGLYEASDKVVTVSSKKIIRSNNGKLVHTIGFARAKSKVSDPLIGFNRKAIKLVRDVEMYQWVKVYRNGRKRYTEKWSNKEIESKSFLNSDKYFNPKMPIHSKTFMAKDVTLGAFKLNERQIKEISNPDSLSLNANMMQRIKRRFKAANKSGCCTIYIGKNSEYSPMVGDLRIKYYVQRNHNLSIIATQNKDTFTAFKPEIGTSVLLVEKGKLGSAEMLDNAIELSAIGRWAWRVAGFFMIYFGLNGLFVPILLSYLPYVGVAVYVGRMISTFLLAFAFSSITIAAGWLFARPAIGFLLIIAALCAIFAVKKIDEKA